MHGNERGPGVTLAAIELDGVLGDVVFLAITVAFFGLAWLVVRMCDHISGTADAATFSARGAPGGAPGDKAGR